MPSEYYVYTLSLPDGTPFYVGKGKGKRINDHGTTRGRLKEVNAVLARLKASGETCLRAIVRGGLTENEAFEAERDLIAQIGRAPNGPLVNCNDGGWGGRNPSASTRERIRRARVAQEPPSREHMVEMNRRRGPWTDEQKDRVRQAHLGRVVSAETRKKISEARKSSSYRPGSDVMRRVASMRGEMTEATREKLREAGRRQVISEERRKRHGDKLRGRPQSPESNAKRSAALKGREKSPEHVAAIKAAKAAKKLAATQTETV